jgi:hypothetical protein
MPMIWQDVVITASQVFFLIALIPTIRSKKEKPPLFTAAMTAFFMTVLVPTTYSLKIYLGTFTNTALAFGWWVVAWQVWRNKRSQSI